MIRNSLKSYWKITPSSIWELLYLNLKVYQTCQMDRAFQV